MLTLGLFFINNAITHNLLKLIGYKALLIPQSVTDGLAHFLTSLSESIIYFDFSAFTAIHVYQVCAELPRYYLGLTHCFA